jgi:hypothetical protein
MLLTSPILGKHPRGYCLATRLYANPLTRTLLVSPAGLEQAKSLIASYKQNRIPVMTPELWKAKKVVDSTLHPGMDSMRHIGKGVNR